VIKYKLTKRTGISILTKKKENRRAGEPESWSEKAKDWCWWPAWRTGAMLWTMNGRKLQETDSTEWSGGPVLCMW